MYTSARQCCALVMSPDLPSDFVTFESATPDEVARRQPGQGTGLGE
jgi:hypothetical protein